jgi:hypothetical protein
MPHRELHVGEDLKSRKSLFDRELRAAIEPVDLNAFPAVGASMPGRMKRSLIGAVCRGQARELFLLRSLGSTGARRGAKPRSDIRFPETNHQPICHCFRVTANMAGLRRDRGSRRPGLTWPATRPAADLPAFRRLSPIAELNRILMRYRPHADSRRGVPAQRDAAEMVDVKFPSASPAFALRFRPRFSMVWL